MHTDGKKAARRKTRKAMRISAAAGKTAQGGKTAAKGPSGRRRVRPYCIPMAFAALIVLVLPVLIRPWAHRRLRRIFVPVLAVTVLPAL